MGAIRIPRLAECAQLGQIAAEESLFFCPGPAFQLGLAGSGFGEGGVSLDAEYSDGRIELGRAASLSGNMVIQPLRKIRGGADVNKAGSKPEKVNYG